MTAKIIQRSLDESLVHMKDAVDHMDYAERNERFTEKEMLENEARLVLMNTYLARLDRSHGEMRKVKSREKLTTV